MARTARPYAPLYSGYWEDEEFGAVGPAAELLYLRGLSHCSGSMTDGFITKRALHTISVELTEPEKLVAKLVRERLWIAEGGGWRVAAWLKYNRSAEDIETLRARDRARKRGDSTPRPGPVPPGIRTESERNPDGFQTDSARNGSPAKGNPRSEPRDSTAPLRPDSRRNPDGFQTYSTTQHGTSQHGTAEPPVAPRKRGTRSNTEEPEGFAEFYQAFPNHKGRVVAARAWGKLSTADREAAMAGVSGYRAYIEAHVRDPHAVLHPGTYLNQRRWEDEPLPDNVTQLPALRGSVPPARIPTTTQRVAEIDALREKMLRGQ